MASYYTSKKRQTDWLLVLLYLAIISIGWASIYSANFADNLPSLFGNLGGFIKTEPGKQLMWIGISLILGFLIQLADRRIFEYLSPLIYIGCMSLLIAVLFIGKTTSGAQSWFQLGFIRIQPSEFSKFATALMCGWYLSKMGVNIRKPLHFIITCAIIFIPFALIIIQGDAGTALVFTSFILVMYREGLSSWFLISIGLAIAMALLTLKFHNYWIVSISLSVVAFIIAIFNFAPRWQEPFVVIVLSGLLLAGFYFLPQLIYLVAIAALIPLVFIIFLYSKNYIYLLGVFLVLACSYSQGISYVHDNILKPHQKNRIGVFVGNIDDPLGTGYNLNQSLTAIGSGGIIGKGYLNGNLTKGNFVPEQSTDFIFCTIGEELGFLGTSIAILLFIALLVRIIQLAERQVNPFARVYAYSAAGILFLHLFINVGMTVGLMPIIGIPLPAMSYGGSSLLGFSILIFIMIKLDADREYFR